MEKVSEVINEIAKYRTSSYDVKKMFEQALKNEKIKEFIEFNGVDYETLKTYRSEIIQFVSRTEAGEKLELEYTETFQHAVIVIREQPPKLRVRSKKLILDDTTESMRGLMFSDLVKDQYNQKLINSLSKLVQDYEKSKNNPGLWVHGEFGRGKTYILGTLANELNAKGIGVAFISARTFASEYTYADFSEKERYLKLISNQEVVILDDMGTETLSPKAFEGLYALFETRLSRLQASKDRQLTFASSNLTINNYVNSIEKSQGRNLERLTTRLINLFLQFNLAGDNRRRV